MKATDRNQSLHTLSSKQLKALSIISSGGTHAEAAAAAQTHRVTITRWANHHPAFVAELNRLKEETVAACSAEILHLTASAMEVLSRALQDDDGEIALRWLRIAVPLVASRATHQADSPRDSREFVEDHRQGMPSTFDSGMRIGFERSTAEAEADLIEYLEE